VIVERLGPAVWRVQLPNGHRLVARLIRRLSDRAAEIEVGRRMQVEVSPCDLSKGRLVLSER
jgi:translation initiation factor IF-1